MKQSETSESEREHWARGARGLRTVERVLAGARRVEELVEGATEALVDACGCGLALLELRRGEHARWASQAPSARDAATAPPCVLQSREGAPTGRVEAPRERASCEGCPHFEPRAPSCEVLRLEGKELSGALVVVAPSAELRSASRGLGEALLGRAEALDAGGGGPSSEVKQALDSIPELVLLLDPGGRVLYAHAPEAHSLRVHAGQELLPLFAARAGEASAADARAVLATALRERRPVDFEVEVPRPEGARSWVGTVSARWGADGELEGFTVVARDHTEQARARKELAHREEVYRLLVDNLEDVVYRLDAKGELVFVNNAARRFGVEPATLVGARRNALRERFLSREDRERARAAEAEGAEPPMPRELTIVDAAGKRRFVRVTERALVVQGELVGRVGVVSDVTRQREAEEQFRASQKMEAVGRLAGGVAHDFNNILTVILANSQLALDAVEAVELRSDLAEVVAAGRRAEALTRQLLAFSRRQKMTLEPVLLSDTVRGLTRMLQRLLGEDVKLEAELAPGDDSVLADKNQLEQVLLNLSVNARDAMPSGGVLRLSTRREVVDAERAARLEVSPGEFCALEVSDTGVGMGPEVLSHLFEPFFTTKPPGQGTGLGLSTVYGIVKQCQGAVAVSSAPGEGARFELLLPRYRGPVAKAFAVEGAPSMVGRERVLLVEDDPAMRRSARRVLEAAGYEVQVSASAAEGLRLCEASGDTFDLLFVDVVMPGSDGRTFVNQARELCPRARVLYTSGHTEELLERHGLRGERYLPKPYDREALRRAVREALDS